MKSYAVKGAGLTIVSALNFSPPLVGQVPAEVSIRRGILWAPPSAEVIKPPPPGAWRCLADTDPKDHRTIAAVARRFGTLVHPESESLELWRRLIDDLRPLTGAWTAEGDRAEPIAYGAAWLAATRLQRRLVEEHQANGGRTESWGAGGFGLATLNMGEWWRLAGLNDLWEGFPLRRCRWCGNWFSLKNQRADQGFGSPRCRSAFHQDRKPPTQPWPEVI